MKRQKKYHIVRTIAKSNIKIIERGKIDTNNTQIHDVTHNYVTAHFPGLVQALL